MNNGNGSASRWVRPLVWVTRLALAGIFLAASYAKLRPVLPGALSLASIGTSLNMFALQVDSYQLLSPSHVTLVAHVLPPVELFLGLWLLSGILLRFSAAITTVLVAAFFSLTIRTFSAGLEISCGCFGPGGKLSKLTILRDGSFLALALALTIGAFWLHRTRRDSSASATEVAPSPGD